MQTANKPTMKAVIYCRVSGSKQVREGDGLASQETRCREYAKFQGYEVVKVLRDDITGKIVKRPAMTEMLLFLRQHRKSHKHVVIIDDISRFARDLRAHLELRSSLAEAGGILESPSIEFGESSDSILIENILASAAQHQREKNAEQTLNRMRSRMINGYWVFQAPIGYKYQKTKTQGKILVRDEAMAAIITEGLEGYASGRFQTQVEVKRFFEAQAIFPKNNKGEVRAQRVTDILTHPLYAGYITHKNWNIKQVKGKHKAQISFETFQRILNRRQSVARVPTRKKYQCGLSLAWLRHLWPL